MKSWFLSTDHKKTQKNNKNPNLFKLPAFSVTKMRHDKSCAKNFIQG